MRIAVVGAGVVGLACAWELRRGGAEVVVLERGAVGGGASRGNTGWVCPSFTYPPTAVIANDVTSFTVTQNAGNATNGQTWNYQVDVQVTKQERVDQTPSVYQLTANVHPIMAGGQ